jgi:NAD(P)-dependent dehydrogenase (short-subunit alcohol dehydrogenase family)
MVTQLFDKNPERKEEWSKHNPLGRLSVPEEYRAATVFLAGSGSSFMTGYFFLLFLVHLTYHVDLI